MTLHSSPGDRVRPSKKTKTLLLRKLAKEILLFQNSGLVRGPWEMEHLGVGSGEA